MPAKPSWYGTPVGFVTPATPHTVIWSFVTPGTLAFCAPAGAATPSKVTANAATITLTTARCFARPVRIGVPPSIRRRFRRTVSKHDAPVRSPRRLRCARRSHATMEPMSEALGTLVCFHAHPDDEVITTGGTIA